MNVSDCHPVLLMLASIGAGIVILLGWFMGWMIFTMLGELALEIQVWLSRRQHAKDLYRERHS